MALEIISGVAGVLLVWLTLRDVFQTAVVPRAPFINLRPSSLVTQQLWRLWPKIAALYPPKRREDVLAAFAPFDMVGLLVLWAALTGLGYGLIFYAFRAQLAPQPIGLHGAIYFAYTTMLTIGFGDVVPHSTLARTLAVLTGGSGLGLVAVVTSYLFSIFGAFAVREKYVIALGARAGTPPSGSGMLATHGYAKIVDALPAVLRDGQQWIAAVVQSQSAYPMLSYFRSKNADESWVGTLGLLLDAATMIATTLENVPKGEAEITIALGRKAAHELSERHGAGIHHEPGCAREHFERTCARLKASGYTLRDPDTAWTDYTNLRATYGPQLNALARYFKVPSIPWSDTA
jgi:hypothetical protein